MKNQPAFPPNAGWRDDKPECQGMTLRQYFAIHILAGILADNDYDDPVAAAVEYADDLIKALEQ